MVVPLSFSQGRTATLTWQTVRMTRLVFLSLLAAVPKRNQ